jgi:acyl-CoA synthetase (AMP-forming)/AMP-acid ligase II
MWYKATYKLNYLACPRGQFNRQFYMLIKFKYSYIYGNRTNLNMFYKIFWHIDIQSYKEHRTNSYYNPAHKNKQYFKHKLSQLVFNLALMYKRLAQGWYTEMARSAVLETRGWNLKCSSLNKNHRDSSIKLNHLLKYCASLQKLWWTTQKSINWNKFTHFTKKTGERLNHKIYLQNDTFRCNNTIVKPSIIEKAIMTNTDVQACAVFAHRCSDLGEVPAAWVVIKPETIIRNVCS